MTRAEAIVAFLERAGWSASGRVEMSGDASSRRYHRLIGNDRSAVLMDDAEGDVRRFLDIASHLLSHGFSAPRILATEVAEGLVLMEDLGERVVADLVEEDPAMEHRIYLEAAKMLVALHRSPQPKSLAPYGPDEMTEMIAPLARFYAPAAGAPISPSAWQDLAAALHAALRSTSLHPPVMIHRDFHAENILWLPERSGPSRIGILDFQDALLGHPAYDLASLLHDVRRDVPARVRDACIEFYCNETGCDESAFRAGFAAQSTQRNLRILGLFARLCTEFGKPGYLAFVPRVWSLLQLDMAHPALDSVREAVEAAVPEPTVEVLQGIRKHAA